MKETAPKKPRATKSATNESATDALRSATERGSGRKRAEALLALADHDRPYAVSIALAWLRDEALEEESGKIIKGVMVAKNKQRPAAVDVLSRELDAIALDALVHAIVLYPLGPTYWKARDALVASALPITAERIVAAISTTDSPRSISCLLTTLRRRGEIANEDLLCRLAIDPLSFPVRIENSVEDFQMDVLEVLVASGSKRVLDVTSEALRAEHSKARYFALHGANVRQVLEMLPENERPAFARSLLAHHRFPRATLAQDVLDVIERAASPV
jgi:hypothetical protein